MKQIVVLFLFPFALFAQFDGNSTPNYEELINQYKKWDAEHDEIQLYQMGNSDVEFPIYVCLINAGSRDSIFAFDNAKNGTTILINNAIHPGEPDGVNASLLWIQNWIKAGKNTQNLPIIAIIPAYNVGGMMNRSGTSRANQDGPIEYGFRGNAQNLDLNRDFIKMDSENAKTFARIYHALSPDVFVDNHVSDGADYQYTLTLIASLQNRLSPSQQQLTFGKMLPEITKSLKTRKIDWAPYVETKGETPDSGIVAFNDLPRYAMGYARLFNALSFTVETHMLKPFPERVQTNLAFMEELFTWTGKNKATIEKARKETVEFQKAQRYFQHHFKTTEAFHWILFKGFEAKYKKSDVTGLDRLYYDRKSPYTKQVKYFDVSNATDSALIPKYYYISSEATSVIDYLKANGVEMEMLDDRLTLEASSLRFVSMKTGTNPYEAHYLHNSVVFEEQADSVELPSGSVKVPCQQEKINFILNVLEPESEDSYFAWNFMDSYIQEKEYFSDYVFEDIAIKLLEENPKLKSDFENKKAADLEFAESSWAQLFFIYQRSPYFESKTFNRLPIYKVYE